MTLKMKFEFGKNKKYKRKRICISAIYVKKSK